MRDSLKVTQIQSNIIHLSSKKTLIYRTLNEVWKIFFQQKIISKDTFILMDFDATSRWLLKCILSSAARKYSTRERISPFNTKTELTKESTHFQVPHKRDFGKRFSVQNIHLKILFSRSCCYPLFSYDVDGKGSSV